MADLPSQTRTINPCVEKLRLLKNTIRKVGRTDLVFGECDEGSVVCLCMQHYKSVCSAYNLCHHD